MAGLLYKEDWDITKEHYTAWWNHDYFGRCAMAVYAQRTNAPDDPPPPKPEKVEDRWLDLDYVTASNAQGFGRIFYGAEGLPIWHPGHPGCDSHPTYLGCEVTLDEETGWIYPFIDCESLTDFDYHQLKVDKEGKWWKFGQECRHRSVKESRGKCIPSNLAIGGCGDTLAALRGTERLLYDVMECPEYVRDFDQYLMKQWIEIYETSYQITHEGAEGAAGWFPIWAPGRYYAAQNDFAYMISPKMYDEIFLPSIEMQTDYLDYCIYHVDGVGNFNHVKSLLELPKLQAFQISPGEGMPSPLHYLDLLKEIQARGKNIFITLPPSEVQTALELLSARGLFIETSCATEEEARALIRQAEKWSVDRG